jgi:hypothetical protein
MASRQHDLMWYRAGADLVVSRPSAIHRLHRGWRLTHLAVAPDHLDAHPAVAAGERKLIGAQLSTRPNAPRVPPQHHDHDQDAHNAPRTAPTLAASRQAQPSQRVDRLTRTLLTKLLTNPLAQSQSTTDTGDRSPASAPVHHTGRLSMAWKRSGVRVP